MDIDRGSEQGADSAPHDDDKATANPLLHPSTTAEYIEKLEKHVLSHLATPLCQQAQQYRVFVGNTLSDSQAGPVLHLLPDVSLPEPDVAAVQVAPSSAPITSPPELLEISATMEDIDEEEIVALRLEGVPDPRNDTTFRRNMDFLAGCLPSMATDTDVASYDLRNASLKKDLDRLNTEDAKSLRLKEDNIKQRLGSKLFLLERAASSAYAIRFGDTPPSGAYQMERTTRRGMSRGVCNKSKLVPPKTQKQEYEAKIEECRQDYNDAFIRNLHSIFGDGDNGKNKGPRYISSTQADPRTGSYNPFTDEEGPRKRGFDAINIDSDEIDEDIIMVG